MSLKRVLLVIKSIPLIIKSYLPKKHAPERIVSNHLFSFTCPEGWTVKQGNNYVILNPVDSKTNSSVNLYSYYEIVDHYKAADDYILTFKKIFRKAELFDFIIKRDVRGGSFNNYPALIIELKLISEFFYLDLICEIHVIHSDNRTFMIIEFKDEKIKEEEMLGFEKFEKTFKFHDNVNLSDFEIFIN